MASAYASVRVYVRIDLKRLYTLRIRRERSKYADIRRYRLCYTQRPYLFGHVQILSAYASV